MAWGDANIEAGLQPAFVGTCRSWGVAPGYGVAAPLARGSGSVDLPQATIELRRWRGGADLWRCLMLR